MIVKNSHPEYKTVEERAEALQKVYTSVQRILYNKGVKEKKDKEREDE